MADKLIHGKIYQDGHFIEGGILFNEKILKVGQWGQVQVTQNEPVGQISLSQKEAVELDYCTDLEGCYIIPGLVDIHTHAALGEDASDGSAEGLKRMSSYYAAEGVTSFLPTTMTLGEEQLSLAMETIRDFERPENGSKIVGIHLEGPFVSYEKRGAQNPDYIHSPDLAMFNRLNQASGNLVKLITLAPEEAGALDFIKEVSPICSISVGHTTADYDTAMAAYQAGASHATHLYNGMPGLHHRMPGVIGAAYDSGAFVELITDGFHIHPSVIRMTFQLFGQQLVLISDSLRCAGMPDGDYVLGGQPITMSGGKAVLSGSDTLAGSSIHLMEGIRRCVKFGVPLEVAVYAATKAPARAIRMEQELGSLKVGRWADFVALDQDLKVKAVYINGRKIGTEG